MFVLDNRLTVGDFHFSVYHVMCRKPSLYRQHRNSEWDYKRKEKEGEKDGHVGRSYLNCECDTVYTCTAVIMKILPAPSRLQVSLPYLTSAISPIAYFALPLLSVHLTREMLNKF